MAEPTKPERQQLPKSVPPPEPAPEAEADESRRMDPELRTIGRIIRMLEEIEESGRSRVMSYLVSRYGLSGEYD